MRNTFIIFKRELSSYFESPVAYVFMIGFLFITNFLTFAVNEYFEKNTADLRWFFMWHPWVMLLLIPAATMGLWAEERRTGTIELLLTMPISMAQAVIGKFLAAWLFISMGLLCTTPIVFTTTFILQGNLDGGAVFCAYMGSILLAGSFIAIGMLTSALTKNQVISFVLAFVLGLILIMAGWPPVTNAFIQWAPAWLVNLVAGFSFMPHYDSMTRGVIDLRDLIYYLSVIVFMLFCSHVVLENRKSA